MDPRVKTPRAGLEQQFELSLQAAEGMAASFDALEGLKRLRAQVKEMRARPGLAPALTDALDALDAKAAALEGGTAARGPGAAPAPTAPPAQQPPADLTQLHSRVSSLLEVLQQSDDAPTTQTAAAAAEFQRQLREQLSAWRRLKDEDVSTLNTRLRAAGLPALAP
jgi:hypothetical protein